MSCKLDINGVYKGAVSELKWLFCAYPPSTIENFACSNIHANWEEQTWVVLLMEPDTHIFRLSILCSECDNSTFNVVLEMVGWDFRSKCELAR